MPPSMPSPPRSVPRTRSAPTSLSRLMKESVLRPRWASATAWARTHLVVTTRLCGTDPLVAADGPRHTVRIGAVRESCLRYTSIEPAAARAAVRRCRRSSRARPALDFRYRQRANRPTTRCVPTRRARSAPQHLSATSPSTASTAQRSGSPGAHDGRECRGQSAVCALRCNRYSSSEK